MSQKAESAEDYSQPTNRAGFKGEGGGGACSIERGDAPTLPDWRKFGCKDAASTKYAAKLPVLITRGDEEKDEAKEEILRYNPYVTVYTKFKTKYQPSRV